VLDRVFHFLLFVGLLGTLSLMLYVGEPGHASWWPGFLVLAVWVITPYVGVSRATRKLWRSPSASLFLVVAAVGVVGASAMELWRYYFVHPSIESRTAFMLMPLWQMVVWALCFVVARSLRMRMGVGH